MTATSPPSSSYLLLRGGTVLTLSKDEHVVPLHHTDVLVRGSIIADVGKNLALPNDVGDARVEVIDCEGKIVSPGFIDTHHHVWQTQLKGRHADHGLLSYMVSGNMMSYAYTPDDMYWGQLSGCLEAIHSGTTTVLDHSHGLYTPEHAASVLSATLDSGIRSVFAYSFPTRISQWDHSQCVPSPDILPEWAITQLGDWAEKYNQRAAPSRVEIALGFDFYFLPREMVLGIFEQLREKGLRVVTSHIGRNALMGLQSPIPMLESYNLLQAPYAPSNTSTALPFLLLSHCNGIPDSDLSLLATKGTAVSSTPETEAQMGMHHCIALDPIVRTAKKTANVSLGIDCHSNGPSFIPLQARQLLLLARAERNAELTAQEKTPRGNVPSTSEEVFNLATIRGARCLGLEGEIGSIEVGKKADLVVFDAARSVGMLSAADYDPVVAVMRFSEAADVDAVVVDGHVRKRDGRLVDVHVETRTKTRTGTSMSWAQVAEQVRRSQGEIQSRIDGLSVDRATETLLAAWHVDAKVLADAE